MNALSLFGKRLDIFVGWLSSEHVTADQYYLKVHERQNYERYKEKDDSIAASMLYYELVDTTYF